jgi:hypothetical protein
MADVDSDAETALANVERKAPLVLDDLDLRVNNRSLVVQRLARPLEYSQRVESVVTGLGIETLLPRLDERVRRFLPIWTDDETTHGRALAMLLHELDLPAYEMPASRLPPHNHLANLLGRVSTGAHRIVELVWSTQGAMNEHMAMAAYSRMAEIAHDIGEHRIRDTLFRPLRSHEAAHKSFYAAHARAVAAQMTTRQRRVARAIVVKTYSPVGAGAKRDKPAFGRTVVDLSAGEWSTLIADPVQQIAERLLADGEPLEPFVRDAFDACVAASARE